MAAIRGLLFDKDGTLFDFSASWGAWARTLLSDLAGGDPVRAEQLGHAIGFDIAATRFAPDSPVIAGTPAEIAEALLPSLPGANPSTLVAHMNAASAAAPLAEAVPLKPLFRQFRDLGLHLGLVTNDAEEPARFHLRTAGIESAFDFIAGFDSGHGAKPSPGALIAFAAGFGLGPHEVAMVGDSRHDMIAARAAGMHAVAVLTGLAGRDDLAPFADAVLPDIGHLPGWIGSLTREESPELA